MDENFSSSFMIPGAAYRFLDLQGSLPVQQPPASAINFQRNCHSNATAQTSVHNLISPTVGNLSGCDHSQPLSAPDCDNLERGKSCISDDEDEPSYTDDCLDGQTEAAGKGKKASVWQRMKWTDSMVRLLITIVSYLGEDAQSDYGLDGRRKPAILQKKGKWKLVSNVMAERGCYVSPQQCEDKFNDLNKRYKKLTDVLGRGTSCKVVENPALLDLMDHLSEKAKEDVRKILSSKHLHFEEMCSYHNGNRLHLLDDPSLQRSLQLALISRDQNGMRRSSQVETGEDEVEADSSDEMEVNNPGAISQVCKRTKYGQDSEDKQSFVHHPSNQDYTKKLLPQTSSGDINSMLTDGSKAASSLQQWMKTHFIQLEEQKLQIQSQMFELEKQRFKWQKFSRKKDKELNKLRMENARLKLQNEKMALELKHMENNFDHK